MHTLVDAVIRRLVAPFSSWDAITANLMDFPRSFVAMNNRNGWLYLLSSLVVAYLVYHFGEKASHGSESGKKSFRDHVFPRSVYLHKSAILDYKFVLIDRFVRMFIYVPLFSGITYGLYIVASRFIGPSPIHLPLPVVIAAVPIVALIVGDFGLFLGHWVMHRWSWLWVFHEVHHSAEVMTPVTLLRVHPIEEFLMGACNSVLYGVCAAVFTSMTGTVVTVEASVGLNVLTFCFYLFGFQLRHSHVWLSYGPLWSRVFISPAQHQIHHSEEQKHWNKNFGYMFAVWDVLFGTIYVPRQRESIVFGCGTKPGEYGTISALYFRPFVKCYRMLRPKRRLRPAVSITQPMAPLAEAKQPAVSQWSDAATAARAQVTSDQPLFKV